MNFYVRNDSKSKKKSDASCPKILKLKEFQNSYPLQQLHNYSNSNHFRYF